MLSGSIFAQVTPLGSLPLEVVRIDGSAASFDDGSSRGLFLDAIGAAEVGEDPNKDLESGGANPMSGAS